jgi:hypothetical protein
VLAASLRPVAAPYVAAAPDGARVRARLRVCARDEAVLWAAGAYLGSLAGRDLAVRCAEGRLDAKGRTRSRAVRKRPHGRYRRSCPVEFSYRGDEVAARQPKTVRGRHLDRTISC